MIDRELPKVGTAVWIRKDGKVLLGLREGGNGGGTWCPPGGHLEMYEDVEASIRRETLEECGLEIENLQFITFTNDKNEQVKKHYVTLCYAADYVSGELTNEEAKIGNWKWFAWTDLPQPLFLPTRNFVETGYNPLEI
jgi:8-oxo-dGTP diphosphatase